MKLPRSVTLAVIASAIAQLSGDGLAESSPEGFKHDVRAEVCRAGGDVVIPRINGRGTYIGGTVLQAVAVAAPAPASAPSEPADR